MATPFAVTLPIKGRKLSPAKQAKLERQLRLIRARQLAVAVVQKRRKKKRLPARVPRQAQPDSIRRQYRAALVAIMAEAHSLTWALLHSSREEIEAAAAGNRKEDGARLDAAPATLFARAAREFMDALPNSQLARVARRFAETTSIFQKSQIIEQFKAVVGIDIFTGITEDWLPAAINDFVQENVSLVRSLAANHFDDLRNNLTEMIGEGKRWEVIADELQERMDISDRHAELIARDQVGKFYGALNEERQTEIGVQRYTWRTVRDNRVRDEHAEREGQTFDWEEPPEDGHPGEAINCRCTAEPDLSGILESLD